jgi:hypothetical protein
MDARQPMRRAFSLLLMLALLTWAESGLATPVYSHASRCHGQMSQQHAASADMPGMSMECCPQPDESAASSSHAIPYSPLSLHRPDCCTVSSQHDQPLTFLVVHDKSFPNLLEASTSAIAPPPLSKRYPGFAAATSPPFTKPVLDQKADLRI